MNAPEFDGGALRSAPPPSWSLRPRKRLPQQCWDFLGAPLRMALLSDHQAERLRLTSLRAERLRTVLPELQGRVLDVGCGDNTLLRLYRDGETDPCKLASVGVDVIQWSEDVQLISSSADLDFS